MTWRSSSGASTKSCVVTKSCARPSSSSTADTYKLSRRTLLCPSRLTTCTRCPNRGGKPLGIKSFKMNCFIPSIFSKDHYFGPAWCAWPSRSSSWSFQCTRSSATAGRSAYSRTNWPLCMTPSPPERNRPWHRSRFSLRILHSGSGDGTRIRTWSRSSLTGESNFATHCP